MDSLLLDVTPKPKAHLSNWQVAVDGEPRTILVFKNYKKKEKDFLLLLSFFFKKKTPEIAAEGFSLRNVAVTAKMATAKKKTFFSFLHFYKNFEGVSQSASTCVYKDSD